MKFIPISLKTIAKAKYFLRLSELVNSDIITQSFINEGRSGLERVA